MSKYIMCLVCGKMTPINRGVCYHCGSPLPSEIQLPLGMIICPNCLKLTPVDTGYCTHCRSPLPPDLVKAAKRELAKYRLQHGESYKKEYIENTYDKLYYNTSDKHGIEYLRVTNENQVIDHIIKNKENHGNQILANTVLMGREVKNVIRFLRVRRLQI